MIKKNRNITDIWGIMVFMAMFFLLICAFQSKSYQKEKNDITYEMVNELHFQNANALTLNLVTVPSFQKESLSDRERNYISPFNDVHKILTDDNKVHQALLSLRRISLIVQPDAAFKFYYHLFSGKSKDYPVLS